MVLIKGTDKSKNLETFLSLGEIYHYQFFFKQSVDNPGNWKIDNKSVWNRKKIFLHGKGNNRVKSQLKELEIILDDYASNNWQISLTHKENKTKQKNTK